MPTKHYNSQGSQNVKDVRYIVCYRITSCVSSSYGLSLCRTAFYETTACHIIYSGVTFRIMLCCKDDGRVAIV